MNTQTTVVPLAERSAFLAAQEARRRNESSYETTVTYMQLPSAHVAWEATDSAVFVSATDIDVLAAWLHVMGGTGTKTVHAWGQTTYTLHTTTWSDSPTFPPVPVHVSVTLPSDVPVMCEIRQAVKAA